MLIIIQAQVHDGNPLFSLSPELNYLMWNYICLDTQSLLSVHAQKLLRWSKQV